MPDSCDSMTPLSMGFPRKKYWNGLPFPSPGDLPNAGIKPESPALQAGSLPLSHQEHLCYTVLYMLIECFLSLSVLLGLKSGLSIHS